MSNTENAAMFFVKDTLNKFKKNSLDINIFSIKKNNINEDIEKIQIYTEQSHNIDEESKQNLKKSFYTLKKIPFLMDMYRVLLGLKKFIETYNLLENVLNCSEKEMDVMKFLDTNITDYKICINKGIEYLSLLFNSINEYCNDEIFLNNSNEIINQINLLYGEISNLPFELSLIKNYYEKMNNCTINKFSDIKGNDFDIKNTSRWKINL